MLRPIDLDANTAITLTEAAALIGSCTGRRPSSSTCWRWALRGVRGRKLEVMRVGGTLYTTRASVEAFLANEHRPSFSEQQAPPTRPASRTLASVLAAERRQREQRAAKQHLDQICSPKKRVTR
jgi:hypothetical protein